MSVRMNTWADDMAAAWQRTRREEKARHLVAQWSSPRQVAKRTTVLRRTFPHAKPDVLLPLAIYGVAPDSPIIAELARVEAKHQAKQGTFAKAGEITGPGKERAEKFEARLTGEFGMDSPKERKYVHEFAQEFAQETPSPTILDELTAPIGALMKSRNPAFRGYTHSFENVPVLGDVQGVTQRAAKGTTRAALIALDTSRQLLNASLRQLAGRISGDFEFDYRDPYASVPNAFEQTQGGQAVKALINGDPVDVGSGIFPDYLSDTQIAAENVSKRTAPLIGGQAWTPGKFVANLVADPDSQAFNLLSGSLDAVVAIKADPLLVAASFARSRQADQVVRLPTGVDEISTARAGLKTAQVELGLAQKAEKAALREADRALAGGESVTASGLVVPGDPVTRARQTAAEATAAREAAEESLARARGVVDARYEAAREGAGAFSSARRSSPTGEGGFADPQRATTWFQSDDGSLLIDYHATNGGPEIAAARQARDAATEQLDTIIARKLILPPDDDVLQAAYEAELTAAKAAHAAAVDQHIAALSEPLYDSWLRYGKKGPLDYHEAQVNATTPGEVMANLDAELGTTLREFPAAKKFRPGWRPALDEYRWAQATPNTPGLWLEDAEQSALQADRWARNAQLPREARAEIFARIATATDERDFYDAATRMFAMVEDDLVTRFNVPRSYAREVTKAYGGDSEMIGGFSRYGTEAETGGHLDHPFMVLNGEGAILPSPQLDNELAHTFIPLPDPREIRRLTKRLGGFAERVRTLRDKLVDDAVRLTAAGDEAGAAAKMKAAKRLDRVANGKESVEALVSGSVARHFRKYGEFPAQGDLAGPALVKRYLRAWVPARLMRAGWGIRVAGEAQFRLAAYGYPSLVRHPMEALGIILGADSESRLGRMLARIAAKPIEEGDTLFAAVARRAGKNVASRMGRFRADPEGARWVGGLDQDEFADALNTNFSSVMETVQPTGLATKTAGRAKSAFVTTTRGQRGWSQAVAGELARLRNSPINRGILSAATPEEAVEWLVHGDGAQGFMRLSRGRTVQYSPSKVGKAVEELTAGEFRSFARLYVDSILDRTHQLTQGNLEIREALITGRLRGAPASRIDQTATILDDLAKEGWEGPRHVRAPLPFTQNQRHAWTDGLNRFMYNLMPRPDNFLNRSPLLREIAWERTVELAPGLAPEFKAALLKNAEIANVSDDVMAALRKAPTTEGGLTLKEVSDLSKAHAVDTTKQILYDLGERHQGWDQLRVLFPFGEAYQEVGSRWLNRMWRNPMVAHRLSQGVTSARQAGFFSKDVNGQEVWTWPGSEALTDFFTGVPVPIGGAVTSLNIVGNGLPGAGPVVQFSAAMIFKNKPVPRDLYEFIFPFGEQGVGGNPFQEIPESMLPTWLVRGGKAGIDRIFGGDDAVITDQTWASTLAAVTDYKASTGEYKLQGPNAAEEAARLERDAIKAAKGVALMRALFSFAAPAAPIPKYVIEDPDNKTVELAVIKDKYNAKVRDPNIGPDKAFGWLIAHYGTKNFLIAEAVSPSSGLLPRTEKQWDWVASHSWVKDAYPDVYGVFAPADPKGEFDITGYSRAQDQANKHPTKQTDRVRQANDRLAQWEYDQLVALVGDDPSEEQVKLLDKAREHLVNDYDGYQTVPVDVGATKRRILQLEQAATDPRVAEASPELAEGLKAYLELRVVAQDAAEADGLKRGSFATATGPDGSMVEVRKALREAGAYLSEKYPAFRFVWQQVLRRELKEDPAGDEDGPQGFVGGRVPAGERRAVAEEDRPGGENYEGGGGLRFDPDAKLDPSQVVDMREETGVQSKVNEQIAKAKTPEKKWDVWAQAVARDVVKWRAADKRGQEYDPTVPGYPNLDITDDSELESVGDVRRRDGRWEYRSAVYEQVPFGTSEDFQVRITAGPWRVLGRRKD